jgi:hypothetical protein
VYDEKDYPRMQQWAFFADFPIPVWILLVAVLPSLAGLDTLITTLGQGECGALSLQLAVWVY